MVLSDAWAPGWSVEVDDRQARPLRVDAILRGVEVPAGTHDVRWRYRAPGLGLGVAISGCAVALAGVWAIVAFRRRRHA